MADIEKKLFSQALDDDLTAWKCMQNKRDNLMFDNANEIIKSIFSITSQNIINYQPVDFLPDETDKSLFLGTHVNVFNYNYFEKQFNNLFKRIKLLNCPINLALVMIDNLEEIAQTYEMPVCVSLISAVSELLQKKLTEPQFASLCVFGYFAVVLPEQTLAESVLAFEKFRNEISDHTFSINNKNYTITTSVGIANYPDHAKSQDELKLASIQALQHAINKGGDRLTVY